MTQVSANATGNPFQSSSGEPDGSTVTSLAPVRLLVALISLAAGLSLVLALRAPLATTVLGLITFGVLHNVLEIRYVAGRFAGLLTGRFLRLLLVLTTGIAGCRLVGGGWPQAARAAEIAIGYVILATGCWIGLRSAWRVAGLAVLGLAALASFSSPGYHFVVLTHLHNLVPLIFLWDWAGRIPSPRGRLAFRLSQLMWILVLPLLILFGAFDRWLSAAPGVAARFVGDGSRVIASAAPPESGAQLGLRFLVMFAFLQTMHYVVWVGFLPRFAPDAAASFDARVPWLRGRRAWLVGIVGCAFLAILFVSDYFQGRALYGALATYHAYLEFPVLLALLMGVRTSMSSARASRS
jgi:hypothetical protein